MLNTSTMLFLLTASLLQGCFGDPSSDDDDDWSNSDSWDGESAPSDPFGADNEPGDEHEESDEPDTSEDSAVPVEPPEDETTADTGTTEESTDDPICTEDYSLCGDLVIPSDFTGTTRSLAIVLYENIPPAGPPDGIVVEIGTPDMSAGDRFPVRVLPAIFNGDYYVWVNLFMEGGGEWAPVNGVDYVGYTADPVNFDGTAISFADISLSLAEGW